MVEDDAAISDARRDFGAEIVKIFDRSAAVITSSLKNDGPSDVAFRKYLGALSSAERQEACARYALEGFLHDLMAFFNDSNRFSIHMKVDERDVDIRENINDSLHVEQLFWLEAYSKFHPVGYEINDLLEF